MAEKPVFQCINEIGDDRENYMIARLGGIAISNSREIFIADMKLMNIRKFGWNGEFIFKAGQRGRGPGDFLSFGGMQWFDDKLFVYDWLGRRIAITDAEMKNFEYIKTHHLDSNLGGTFSIRNDPIALDSERIFAINTRYDDEIGRLFIFNRKQKILRHFFCHLPADIASEKHRRHFNPLTHPIAGVNHQDKKILVTFDYPDREILFYLYDFSGQLLRQFKYTQEKGYRFPMEKFESFRINPPRMTMILDILAYKSYYMVLLINMIDYDREERSSKSYFLFFRDTGEFLYKLRWNVRFLTINPEGYLGGIDKDEDDENKVVIYKFNPKALEALARKSN